MLLTDICFFFCCNWLDLSFHSFFSGNHVKWAKNLDSHRMSPDNPNVNSSIFVPLLFRKDSNKTLDEKRYIVKWTVLSGHKWFGWKRIFRKTRYWMTQKNHPIVENVFLNKSILFFFVVTFPIVLSGDAAEIHK